MPIWHPWHGCHKKTCLDHPAAYGILYTRLNPTLSKTRLSNRAAPSRVILVIQDKNCPFRLFPFPARHLPLRTSPTGMMTSTLFLINPTSCFFLKFGDLGSGCGDTYPYNYLHLAVDFFNNKNTYVARRVSLASYKHAFFCAVSPKLGDTKLQKKSVNKAITK